MTGSARRTALGSTTAIGMSLAMFMWSPDAMAAEGCDTTTPDIGQTIVCDATETITVPTGAKAVEAVVVGGGGGGGAGDTSRLGGDGGAGAKVTATITLPAGSALQVDVGSGGGASSAGDGGGYSRIIANSTLLVVAGGGGGGGQGGGDNRGGGGDGGASSISGAGGNGQGWPQDDQGGRGGSGGTGGLSGVLPNTSEPVGSGDNYNPVSNSGGLGAFPYGGSGGGGGDGFGGGGSGVTGGGTHFGGGGAGGSYANPNLSANSVIFTAASGDPGSVGLGGLGGSLSSFGTAGSDGSVTITFIKSPGPPASVSATAGDEELSFTWTAPTDDGGTDITEYQYQIDDGGWQNTNTDTPTTVTILGRTNGTTYSIRVRALNSYGTGEASSPVSVTPVSSSDPPGVPASLEVLPGGSTLDLSWAEPSPGGAPISDYEYKTDSDPWLSLNTTNTTSTITTDSTGVNLDPATSYAIQVRAVNTNGSGNPSASMSQTPGVPLAPQNPSSTWSEDSLSLSWSAAAANGDPVTEYQIVVSQLSQRSGFRMLRSGPGTYTTTSTSFTVTGLNPVPTYTITLSARNGRGWGVPTSFTVAGTGEVEAHDQTPPSIIQQVGLPVSGRCEDLIDGVFGTQTFIQGGWGQSWALWMNGGLGGAVCTRMLVYSNAHGRWVVADA